MALSTEFFPGLYSAPIRNSYRKLNIKVILKSKKPLQAEIGGIK